MSTREFRGPIEDGDWPERPVARAVAPGPKPRIRGYAVDDDLALNTSAAERVWLTLKGELPDAAQLCAFEVTLAFASPAHVGEAPTGAAIAARLAGGRKAGFIQTACAVLGEQAQRFDAIGASLETWRDDRGVVPAALAPGDDEHAERTGAFAEAIRAAAEDAGDAGLEVRWAGFGLMAALADAWWQLGIRRAEEWIALWVHARLPAVVAEAMYVRPGTFHLYPMNTPEFRYEEDER
jgi:hypothetical protein